MNKHELAIVRYESARVKRNEVKRDHAYLISTCERVQLKENKIEALHSTTCGQKAWNKMRSHNLNLPYDEQDSYEDVFFNVVNNSDGACTHCKGAHKLKFSKLAEANKEFGRAKVALSSLGKKLIQGAL